MQCKKCGYENMEGARICQRCGEPLGQGQGTSSDVPIWFGSRIIGFLTVMIAVVAMVGVFLPWVKATPIFGAPAETPSAIASGWDLMTESGDVQEGVEPYAILAFAGGVVLVLGAAWALADPQSKNSWATAALGGLLAIGGTAWGWQALSSYAFLGVDPTDVTISVGVGLYLTFGGGIAAVIAGIIGRFGTPEHL